MRGSEYADLKAFMAIVELRSFTRAAGHLRVSPSNLSQAIKSLEDRLGERLLNRTTRSVAPTDAGRTLYERLLPAMGELEAAVAGVGEARVRLAGTLRVCFTRLSATLFLEPILGEFYRTYPEIVLDVTIDDSLRDIVAGGYDVGARMGERLERNVTAVRLGERLDQLVVASPGYLRKNGTPLAPTDLHRHRCINWRRQGDSRLYDWVFQKKNGARFSVAVDGPLIVSDRALAVAAAVQGVGITMAPEPRVRRLIEKGKLVSVLDAWRFPYEGWHLFYPRQRHTPATVLAFVDFVQRHSRKGLRDYTPKT